VIYIKWAAFSLMDWLLLPVWFLGAPVVSLFTRAQPDLDENTKPWGWLFGTYDNPPQGDAKHQREGLFPGAVNGWKGYVMRVLWLWRNPGYNFQRLLCIHYSPLYSLDYIGNSQISDKYKTPGYYFAKLCDNEKLIGFEFYCVYPWAFGKCVRVRFGWKLMTDKFERYQFAPLVNTANPLKSYGDD
jgi:hypothetical protein